MLRKRYLAVLIWIWYISKQYLHLAGWQLILSPNGVEQVARHNTTISPGSNRFYGSVPDHSPPQIKS